jgi:hypothetical protein
MPRKGKRVSASEIGQYAYCARAWWLAVIEKREPENPALLDAGRRTHERHAWQVALARTAARLALILLSIAVLTLLAWALVTLLW